MPSPSARAEPVPAPNLTDAWPRRPGLDPDRPWPVVIGLAALYLPFYLGPGHRSGLDEGIAPPLVAAISAWLLWRAWRAEGPASVRAPERPARVAGSLTLALGLLLFLFGRMLQFPLAEAASQLPVLAGIVLLLRGRRTLGRAAFAIGFLVFLLPLPEFVVAELTGPLSLWGAKLAAGILRLADYPVAASGATLAVGRYLLLVNEACAGLGSMISLAATGLLFVHLAGPRPRLHRWILIAAVLPMAFLANTLRIFVLALITYHLGDAVGRGPAHEASGMLLFVWAIGLLFALDALLRRVLPGRP